MNVICEKGVTDAVKLYKFNNACIMHKHLIIYTP